MELFAFFFKCLNRFANSVTLEAADAATRSTKPPTAGEAGVGVRSGRVGWKERLAACEQLDGWGI